MGIIGSLVKAAEEVGPKLMKLAPEAEEAARLAAMEELTAELAKGGLKTGKKAVTAEWAQSKAGQWMAAQKAAAEAEGDTRKLAKLKVDEERAIAWDVAARKGSKTYKPTRLEALLPTELAVQKLYAVPGAVSKDGVVLLEAGGPAVRKTDFPSEGNFLTTTPDKRGPRTIDQMEINLNPSPAVTLGHIPTQDISDWTLGGALGHEVGHLDRGASGREMGRPLTQSQHSFSPEEAKADQLARYAMGGYVPERLKAKQALAREHLTAILDDPKGFYPALPSWRKNKGVYRAYIQKRLDLARAVLPGAEYSDLVKKFRKSEVGKLYPGLQYGIPMAVGAEAALELGEE